jgi:membrane fusion protein (multidrug efflux system)
MDIFVRMIDMRQQSNNMGFYKGIGLVLCLFIAACSETPSTPPVKVVEVATVQKGDIQESITLLGTIRTKKKVLFTAKSSGILDYVAQTGDTISKGILIAQLENSDLEKSRKFAQETAEIAQQQYDRMRSLEKSNVLSKQRIEESKGAWLDTQNAFLQANMAWEQSRFVAPFDGIVGVYKSREGAQVQSGDPIVTFYDPNQLFIELDIPAKFVKHLRVKQEVMVQGKPFVMTSLQKMIDADTHMAPATVEFICPGCLVGEVIPVQVPVQIHHAVYWVPAGTIFQKEGKSYVYVVQENKLKRVAVKPGLQEQTRLEIVSGLKAGDAVVIKGQDRLHPGMTVQIAQEAPVQLDTEQSESVVTGTVNTGAQ